MNKKIVVLEQSTHTHVLEGEVISKKDLPNSMILLNVKGDCVVKHDEHDTLRTNNPYILKVVQQELNPVTKEMQNAFD